MPKSKPKKAGKRLPLASERAEQQALVEWFSYAYPDVKIASNVNEGKRSPREGVNLLQAGLSPGYPDLSIPQARGGYFGLYIELKQDRDYSAAEMRTKTWLAQADWLTYLATEHYFAIRCFGWNRAREVIQRYMSWPKTLFMPQHPFVDFTSLS